MVKKLFRNMTDAEKRAAQWEQSELIEENGYFTPYGKVGKIESVVNNVARRGYDAARISQERQ